MTCQISEMEIYPPTQSLRSEERTARPGDRRWRDMERAALVDTHAHLADVQFDEDRDAVLERARAQGVAGVLVVSETVAEAAKVAELSDSHKGFLWPAAGLHPVHVAALSDADADRACDRLERLIAGGGDANETEYIALGEVGLDFTPRVLSSGTGDVRARQRRVFERLLRAATAAGLPATVHSRGAGHHALAVAAAVPDAVVCMHAFDGRPVYAERAVEECQEGMRFFSIPPSVVRDEGTQKLVRRVPLTALLLESDSPALGPVKGERNEPGNVARTVEMIAALKDVSVEEVAVVLLENTRRCFKGMMAKLEAGLVQEN